MAKERLILTLKGKNAKAMLASLKKDVFITYVSKGNTLEVYEE